MKAILVYWLMNADGSGAVVLLDQPSVAACYAMIGAGVANGTNPDPRAKVQCRPQTDAQAILGEMIALKCKVHERRDDMIGFVCAGNK